MKRQKQIEHELATGNFLIPSAVTVAEFLMDWLPKQKRTLSGTTLHEVHQLLHNSFLLAVEWGILIKSPVPVEAPQKTTQERSIWEVDEMRATLDWLLYNKPLEYTQMVLRGEMEHYLSLGCDHGRLED